MTIVWLLAALLSSTRANQPATQPDPHRGQFTNGTGRRCASCHDKSPYAEDMYRAAATMEKMTADLNRRLLKPFGGRLSCFSCHRGGGPEHSRAHPQSLGRRSVQAIVSHWPGDARDPDPLRRTMGEYAVSLGVTCDYCHTVGNWKADSKQAMKTTRAMTAVMNEFPKYYSFATASAFTCFTCHQGERKVAR